MLLCRVLQVLCLPRHLWHLLLLILAPNPTPTAIPLVYLPSMMVDTLRSRPSAVSTARRCRPTVPRPCIIPTPPLHPHPSDHHSHSTRRLLPFSRSARLCNNPPTTRTTLSAWIPSFLILHLPPLLHPHLLPLLSHRLPQGLMHISPSSPMPNGLPQMYLPDGRPLTERPQSVPP